jgi:hypothetical protein
MATGKETVMDDDLTSLWFANGILFGFIALQYFKIIALQEHVRQLRMLSAIQKQMIDVLRETVFKIPRPPVEDREVYDKGANP